MESIQVLRGEVEEIHSWFNRTYNNQINVSWRLGFRNIGVCRAGASYRITDEMQEEGGGERKMDFPFTFYDIAIVDQYDLHMRRWHDFSSSQRDGALILPTPMKPGLEARLLRSQTIVQTTSFSSFYIIVIGQERDYG